MPHISLEAHAVNHTATSVHKCFELRTDAEDVVRAGKHYPVWVEDLLLDGLEFILLRTPPFPVTGVAGKARKYIGASKDNGFCLCTLCFGPIQDMGEQACRDATSAGKPSPSVAEKTPPGRDLLSQVA